MDEFELLFCGPSRAISLVGNHREVLLSKLKKRAAEHEIDLFYEDVQSWFSSLESGNRICFAHQQNRERAVLLIDHSDLLSKPELTGISSWLKVQIENRNTGILRCRGWLEIASRNVATPTRYDD